MHFSDNTTGTGSKFTKIAIVSALHVAVGAALIHNMDSKMFSMPQAVEELTVFLPEAPKPPPPPPEPPQVRQKPVTQPKVFTPPVEVEVPQEPVVEAPLQSTSAPAPAADPGPATPEAPPSNAPGDGQMFSAALANADACAKPDYPAKAARNGEAGTVSLALLIGTDGRVSDSKVQRSSGSRELDRAAQAALSLCQFKPAMQGGAPQPAWGQIAYVWTLE
jgi:protein TonB